MQRTLLPLAIVLAVFQSACAYHLDVRRGSPRPNIVSSSASSPSRLVLGPEVLDEFIVPNTGAIYQVNVFEWRATLQAGFEAGFTPGGSAPALEIIRAELSFAPEAVDARGITRAARAVIRFQARTLDASGAPMEAFSGTANASEAITDISGNIPTVNAARAVETMYELIAAQFYSSARAPSTAGGETF